MKVHLGFVLQLKTYEIFKPSFKQNASKYMWSKLNTKTNYNFKDYFATKTVQWNFRVKYNIMAASSPAKLEVNKCS